MVSLALRVYGICTCTLWTLWKETVDAPPSQKDWPTCMTCVHNKCSYNYAVVKHKQKEGSLVHMYVYQSVCELPTLPVVGQLYMWLGYKIITHVIDRIPYNRCSYAYMSTYIRLFIN